MVAYSQPISRGRISAVRGVNVDGVVRTLVARGLIAEAGHDADSGAVTFVTTGHFLERMGLDTLDELPPLAPHLRRPPNSRRSWAAGLPRVPESRRSRGLRRAQATTMTEGVRLQKVLAAAGVASRRAAEQLIAEGRVEVNGRLVIEQGMRIDPDSDVVRVDGSRIPTARRHVYLVLNKPRGVVSTLDDPEGRRDLREFLADRQGAAVPRRPAGHRDQRSADLDQRRRVRSAGGPSVL